MLKVELDNVLFTNKRLNKEVERLKAILEEQQDSKEDKAIEQEDSKSDPYYKVNKSILISH